jgi:hypothetical protein
MKYLESKAAVTIPAANTAKTGLDGMTQEVKKWIDLLG